VTNSKRPSVSMRAELYRRLCHHADEVTGESRAGLVGRAIEELLERESKDAPPENWEPEQRRGRPPGSKARRAEAIRSGEGDKHGGIHSW
jgi:predicted transcriptional regulator